jgi:hypothetical protein
MLSVKDLGNNKEKLLPSRSWDSVGKRVEN